jgi:hypothetical protein
MIMTLTVSSVSGLDLFIAACALVVLVGAASAWIDQHLRSRRYRRAKQAQAAFENDSMFLRTAPIAAALEKAQAPSWFQSCQNDINAEHESANYLQKWYHRCVAQCIAVLSMGVLVTCISAIAVRSNEDLERFAAHYDLIATLYALTFFTIARFINPRFVKQRSFTELLRAWVHLAIVFPFERSGEMRLIYGVERERIHDRVDARARSIYDRVEQYWTEIEAECRSLDLRPKLSIAEMGFYLKERPLEQLYYFAKAQQRIHEGQRGREILMLSLYLVSVSLAILKALSVFKSGLPLMFEPASNLATLIPLDWISTALLGLMAISAAVTNGLISRNDRSLLHSYHAQERRIRKWFEAVAEVSKNGDLVMSPSSILSFEDIMLNELLDFIHITSRDVIEIPG